MSESLTHTNTKAQRTTERTPKNARPFCRLANSLSPSSRSTTAPTHVWDEGEPDARMAISLRFFQSTCKRIQLYLISRATTQFEPLLVSTFGSIFHPRREELGNSQQESAVCVACIAKAAWKLSRTRGKDNCADVNIVSYPACALPGKKNAAARKMKISFKRPLNNK